MQSYYSLNPIIVYKCSVSFVMGVWALSNIHDKAVRTLGEIKEPLRTSPNPAKFNSNLVFFRNQCKNANQHTHLLITKDFNGI